MRLAAILSLVAFGCITNYFVDDSLEFLSIAMLGGLFGFTCYQAGKEETGLDLPR